MPLSVPIPVQVMQCLGLEPDPWQLDVLTGRHSRLLLNCCRQAGKSVTVAALALSEALFAGGTKVLIVSRSFRQAAELFRTITEAHRRLGAPNLDRRNSQELALKNGSRVICLPCREDTIRGFSAIDLLLLDEAARIPDDVYKAVHPMLAVSGGRMICLSTPYGKRGFFWHAWAHEGADWHRIEIPASRVPRIPADFLESERRALGESWFRQEYCCSFESLEGLVFPGLPRCVVAGPAPTGGKKVGGIDFGFRNPFAAVWGVLDRDDVLWLTGEHYARQKTLSFHADHLPRDVTWYADPAGATERAELRHAGFTISEGYNALRPGIAAVTARIEAEALKIVAGACPNLLTEATLYAYADDASEGGSEEPIDRHNHALSALRYLVSRLDRHHQVPRPPADPPKKKKARDPWLSLYNEALWHLL